MHDGNWNDGWAWLGMAAMMLVFWGGLVLLVVALVRRTVPIHHASTVSPAPPPPPVADPAQVLADRLARGEIDVEDYHLRLAALQGSRPTDR